jgi:hypothetical protein
MTSDVCKIWDDALTAWIGQEERVRLKAIVPGAGKDELICKLQAAERSHWERICCQHARERAEEVCAYHKDGDLWYRDGHRWWNLYWNEIYDALKAVTKNHRAKRQAYDAAGITFVETVDRIRDKRLGPPEQRAAMEEAGLPEMECSETLGDYIRRMEQGGAE